MTEWTYYEDAECDNTYKDSFYSNCYRDSGSYEEVEVPVMNRFGLVDVNEGLCCLLVCSDWLSCQKCLL